MFRFKDTDADKHKDHIAGHIHIFYINFLIEKALIPKFSPIFSLCYVMTS